VEADSSSRSSRRTTMASGVLLCTHTHWWAGCWSYLQKRSRYRVGPAMTCTLAVAN
jgi:hypothetical protein